MQTNAVSYNTTRATSEKQVRNTPAKKKDKFLVASVIALMFLALALAVLANSVSRMREQELKLMEMELRMAEVSVTPPQEQLSASDGGNAASEVQAELIAEEPQTETETYVCTSSTEVKAYQYPDITSAVVGKIQRGSKVEVKSEGDQYYCCILSNGKEGYVAKRYLYKDGDFVHVPGAVDLREYLPGAQFEMLFASPNNITGHAMYPAIPILEESTAKMLLKAAEIFRADGYVIKIYDAYRPKSAQYELYDIVKDSRFIANPYVSNSWHQLGRAVDMSLVNARTGEELEMPTPMHTFDLSAARGRSGTWTDAARINVDYMTSVMQQVGFGTINSEWWHFENTKSEGGYLPTDLQLDSIEYRAG